MVVELILLLNAAYSADFQPPRAVAPVISVTAPMIEIMIARRAIWAKEIEATKKLADGLRTIDAESVALEVMLSGMDAERLLQQTGQELSLLQTELSQIEASLLELKRSSDELLALRALELSSAKSVKIKHEGSARWRDQADLLLRGIEKKLAKYRRLAEVEDQKEGKNRR